MTPESSAWDRTEVCNNNPGNKMRKIRTIFNLSVFRYVLYKGTNVAAVKLCPVQTVRKILNKGVQCTEKANIKITVISDTVEKTI
jgi:hypothetical protein